MNKEPKPGETLSLELLRRGDKNEFAELVEANTGQIYRLGLKILGDPQDAEDILQETFIKAYRALPDFDGRSSLSTWLYRIATNEALMLLRRRGKGEQISIEEPQDDVEIEQEPLQIVDWCCMPEEELISSEARAYMEQAVDRLPNSMKIVFLLRDIEGLSTRQTAEVLNLTEVSVKTRLSRARMRLREMLTEYYAEKMMGRATISGGEV